MTGHRRVPGRPALRAVLPDDEDRETFWLMAASTLVVWSVGCWTWAMGVTSDGAAAGLTVLLLGLAALTLNTLWVTSRPVVVGAVVLAGLARLLTIVGATTASGLLMGLAGAMAGWLIGTTRLRARTDHQAP